MSSNRFLYAAVVASSLIAFGFDHSARAQSQELTFKNLPTTIKRHIRNIRSECDALNEVFKIS
jgi:hypothetical protein